uniref:F-box only protein 46-like n=1 Tax=Sinocyclocheilus rhinocerous TaxID=307959 RepID=A0A673IHM3_9TELE
MNRDTFSHIRLWCPRPFGTYSQNKPYSNGTICNGTAATHCKADDSGLTTLETHGVSEEQDEDVGTENTPPDASSTLLAPPLPASPSPNSQMEDGRVLLDTWYVIKPGNTKEKIAFFVAHQCNGAGIPRPSAMKVKGNWATDCTKAKRRRLSETDLLSVAEMVALVEQLSESPSSQQNLNREVRIAFRADSLGEAVARERVTGFHVEVVVTGAVDQCVFYGKDSTENDPPPGQLFFLQSPRPDSPLSTVDDCSDPPLCRLYRHVSHDFLEIRFQIQRLLEPRQYMLSLPDHIMVNIFSYLPTHSLAALKCTCHDFKTLIETYGVRATDSRWNQDPLYRDDPCKQCKRQYERGDVSLCRWHPKPYHHDLPYGRSYWMCCRRTDKDTPGCRVGLHDNNWVQPCELVQARAKRDDGR